MKKRWATAFNLGLLLIVLLGGSLRFFAIGAKSIWLDEAFSIWIAKHSVAEIGQWLVQIDQHPPLYYVLLHFWVQALGDLQGPVRAFSALCSTLAIPVFYAAGKKLYSARVGLLAALLLAVAPFHVRFAQEARMYALLTLLVAAALYFLATILNTSQSDNSQSDNPQSGIWRWIGLSLSQVAIMLTHNTAAVYFPVALNLAILLIVVLPPKGAAGAPPGGDRQSAMRAVSAVQAPGFLAKWGGFQALALLLWSVWAPAFIVQTQGVDQMFWISPPTVDSVLATLHTLILAHFPGWFPLSPLADLLFWGIAAAGVYRQRHLPARAILLCLLCMVPIVVGLLVSLRRPIFYDRTLIWVTLPLYLLMAVGLEEMGRRVGAAFQARLAQGEGVLSGVVAGWARMWQRLSMGMILLVCGLALLSYYVSFEKEDWDKGAAYVAERVQPGDMIIFNATWVQLPFDYYFRHYDKDVELRGLPVDLFDRGVLEPRMAKSDLPHMRQLVANRPRIWLVYSHDWYTDPNQIILQELRHGMELVAQEQFEGLQIMQFAE